MKRFQTLCVLASCVLPCGGWSQQTPARPLPPEPSLRSVTPADRLAEGWWAARHQAILAEVRAQPDASLVVLGDSITQNYEKSQSPDQNFLPIWKTFYEPRHALNLGFSGDATEHVLWRLEHGEVAGLHPKAVLLLLGTNNTGHEHQSAQETEAGLDAVIASLERRLPETKILLLGILPSDLFPEKTAQDRAVNQYLANAYAADPRVTFLDISSVYDHDGKLATALFYDPRLPHPGGALHPDTDGQRRMAEAVEPTLAHLLGEPPVIPLASMTAVNTALIPVPKLEQDSYDWYARHGAELFLQQSMHPSVVLIGDSITHFWDGPPYSARRSGIAAWQHAFGTREVLNLGFGWDRTQNVLWRLQHGEFQGLTPEWVVLNIGTNNLTGTDHARASTPAEVVAGIQAICTLIHQRSPASRILVMKIFPRGHLSNGPLREPIRQVNDLLQKALAGQTNVTLLDAGPGFLAPDGSIPAALMPDGTHPSDAGYQIWANTLLIAGLRPQSNP